MTSKQYTFADYLDAVGLVPPEGANLIIHPNPPYDHQVTALISMLKFRHDGLYDDAGTGKTFPLQAYSALQAMIGNKVIVVMPPVLLEQFNETFDEFFQGYKKYFKVAIFKGGPDKREKMAAEWIANGWPDILMMTYQMFSQYHHLKDREDKVIHTKKGTSYIKKGHKKDKVHRLKQFGYNTLVFDESQALKTSGSGVTRITFKYVQKEDCQLILSTGSPLGNTPEDCYAPIRLITPDIYHTKGAFERKHVVRNIHSPYKEIIDFTNLDLLHQNLFKQARRVTKEEVNKNLPDKLLTRIPVKLSPAHMKLYRTLLQTRILKFKDQVLDATQATRLRMTALQLISSPENYVDDGVKIVNEMDVAAEALMDMIDPGQHKIIIFSHFKSTVARLKEHYNILNPAIINSTAKDINAERLKFTKDPQCRLAIINYKSGGAGLNLQVSSHSLFYEAQTVPSAFHQAFARTHRDKQTAKCVNGYLLEAERTLLPKQIKQLLEKDATANEVIRDPGKLLKELLAES